jgi:hypothetical protein
MPVQHIPLFSRQGNKFIPGLFIDSERFRRDLFLSPNFFTDIESGGIDDFRRRPLPRLQRHLPGGGFRAVHCNLALVERRGSLRLLREKARQVLSGGGSKPFSAKNTPLSIPSWIA